MLGMRQLNAAPYCKGWGALTVNPDFVEAFPTGDLRRSASIIDLVGEGITGSATLPPVFNDWREYTGYAVKKVGSPLLCRWKPCPVSRMVVVTSRHRTAKTTLLSVMPTYC